MYSWTCVKVVLGLAVAVNWMYILAPECGDTAEAAQPKPKKQAKSAKNDSIITLPPRQDEAYPWGITLSPNGRWLAVLSNYCVLVYNTKTGRWVRRFYPAFTTARWHTTKPVLIVPESIEPDYWCYMAYLSNGKRDNLFQGFDSPFAVVKAGMIWQRGSIDLAKSSDGIATRNYGYHIPWDYDDKAEVVYMSGGNNNEIAVELSSNYPNKKLPPKWMEMYRKARGRMQWLRSGKIVPEMKERVIPEKKGKRIVWEPRKPTWLRDGRLLYLRIYPAQWTQLVTGPGIIIPGALTAKNRAELWVCKADGTGQRKITTLWDLRLYTAERIADWITVDQQSKKLYYISGKGIRTMSLAGRL